MQVTVPGSGRPYLDGDSLDHTVPLVFEVARVMDPAECAAMIARIEAAGPALAPVSLPGGAVVRTELRNNTRVMFDDAALAAELYRRLAGALPPAMCGRRLCGVNERFRCYRYEPGQQFRAHYDGSFRRGPREASELTLMVYLNDGFGGGTTAFLDFLHEVRPRAGAGLMFQHRLLHEGTMVTSGVKYVLRTDVMYGE